MKDLPEAAGRDDKPPVARHRRHLLKKMTGLAAVTLAAQVLGASNQSRAADAIRRLKLAISLPARHPISAGLQAACADILRESQGRLEIEVFANGELGSDTDTISQVRAGAIDFLSTAGLVWGTLVPVASMSVTAFAFPDYTTVWKAMDGELGAHIRAAFEAVNLQPMTRIWDHGFRHITMAARPINSPQGLVGAKIRVPMSPMLISQFRALGAAPASINYSELYTALQTHIVDGQENPLSLVDAGKLYEVQKFCSLTSHAWDGFWLCANKQSWNRLPADLREIAARNFDAQALRERSANASLNSTLTESLKSRGMALNTVDGGPFRKVLQKAGYYNEWKQKLGVHAWELLERCSGPLV
jgi:tripartite ATP-independent transporter DctP family solute receptor